LTRDHNIRAMIIQTLGRENLSLRSLTLAVRSPTPLRACFHSGGTTEQRTHYKQWRLCASVRGCRVLILMSHTGRACVCVPCAFAFAKDTSQLIDFRTATRSGSDASFAKYLWAGIGAHNGVLSFKVLLAHSRR
jgi:hypothetical protein